MLECGVEQKTLKLVWLGLKCHWQVNAKLNQEKAFVRY